MVTFDDDTVTIQIDEEELIESIAMLEDMRDFLKLNGGDLRLIWTINTAIDAEKAIYLEHFGGGK